MHNLKHILHNFQLYSNPSHVIQIALLIILFLLHQNKSTKLLLLALGVCIQIITSTYVFQGNLQTLLNVAQTTIELPKVTELHGTQPGQPTGFSLVQTPQGAPVAPEPLPNSQRLLQGRTPQSMN